MWNGEIPSVHGTNVVILSFSGKQAEPLRPRACGNIVPCLRNFARVRAEFILRHNEIPASYFQKFGAYEINYYFCAVYGKCMQNGELAHLVERLVRNQKVVGSSPIFSTKVCVFYAIGMRLMRCNSSFGRFFSFLTQSGSPSWLISVIFALMFRGVRMRIGWTSMFIKRVDANR